MNWNRNPCDGISETAGDLAHPPAAGKMKLVLLGIVLPLALAAFPIEMAP